MKKFRMFAALALCGALAFGFVACSNASGGGGGGGGGQSEADLAAAAAKAKYLAMAGTWTKVDSQGKTNTLVIDAEKATLTFASDGEYRLNSNSCLYADTKTLRTGQYSERLDEYKGIATLGAATSAVVSLHPDFASDYTQAISTLMAGTGRNFTASDVCLYMVRTEKNSATSRTNPYIYALALRKTSDGKVEAMFVRSDLKDSSPVFSTSYSITFEKKSGTGSGGSGGESLSFSVYGTWKNKNESVSGRYIKINSDGTFDMYKNGSVSSLYTNRTAALSGARITLSYKMSSSASVSVRDIFEVSGTASQMKWTLVSSETTTSGVTSEDNNHSALLQTFFGAYTNEITFVPN